MGLGSRLVRVCPEGSGQTWWICISLGGSRGVSESLEGPVGFQESSGGSDMIGEGPDGSRMVWTGLTDVHWSGRVHEGQASLRSILNGLGGSKKALGGSGMVWEALVG